MLRAGRAPLAEHPLLSVDFKDLLGLLEGVHRFLVLARLVEGLAVGPELVVTSAFSAAESCGFLASAASIAAM